jgi:hypothetical protein
LSISAFATRPTINLGGAELNMVSRFADEKRDPDRVTECGTVSGLSDGQAEVSCGARS